LFWLAFCVTVPACSSIPPRPASVEPAPPTTTTREPQSRAPRAEALLQALLALGIDYRDGGHSPVDGFDCSGLVAHVYREAYGLRLPRNARAQSETGVAVSLAELEAGDLVFYDTLGRPFSHVGIYLGDGRFVHAPKTGSRVRIERMRAAYWMKRFNGARRIEPRAD
jgi:cell wall-associated NlpC family hydrolase